MGSLTVPIQMARRAAPSVSSAASAATVLLVNPTRAGFDSYCTPPLHLLYIADAIARAGHQVSIYDMHYQLNAQVGFNWGSVTPARKHQIEDQLIEEILSRPFDVLGVGSIVSSYGVTERLVQACARRKPTATIILGGALGTTVHALWARHSTVQYLVEADGEEVIQTLLAHRGDDEFLKTVPGVYVRDGDHFQINRPVLSKTLDHIPFPNWDRIDHAPYRRIMRDWIAGTMPRHLQPLPTDEVFPIVATRGCPYHCLRGDTMVNTIDGPMAIKVLAETKETIPVYTYKDGEVFIADAIHIRKIGVNQSLVRVHFDDGSHLDCTPDHRVLQFAWGNTSGTTEWAVEAQFLKTGAHVRAIRTELSAHGRAVITWGRRARRHRSRLIMDYLQGHRLSRAEQVHHIDHDKLNDRPDNLRYCAYMAEHMTHHPELAQRMREQNPVRKMTPAWRAKITAAVTGKVRTVEQREQYRQSKLGAKNPNYKPALHEVNHVVTRIERLNEREDVYCLEVPATGWFFANDVLVKNCTFCFHQMNDWTQSLPASYRKHSVDYLVRYIRHLRDRYGLTLLVTWDDLIMVDKTWFLNLCEALEGARLGVRIFTSGGKANIITREMCAAMARAGFIRISYGIESGSDAILTAMKKGHKVKDNRNAIVWARDAGLHVHANMIAGMPGETRQTLRETEQFLKDCDLSAANISYAYATAYPGTELFEIGQSRGFFPDVHAFAKHTTGVGEYRINWTGLPRHVILRYGRTVRYRVQFAWHWRRRQWWAASKVGLFLAVRLLYCYLIEPTPVDRWVRAWVITPVVARRARVTVLHTSHSVKAAASC